MFQTLLETLQGSPVALWLLFALLISCGIGLPLPEDVILITAGMVAEDQGIPWISTCVLMYVGVLAGDTMIFYVGRHFGAKALRLAFVQRFFSPKKQARVQTLFERYGATVLFVGRFLPGLRAPIFCTAGIMHVRYVKFALLDGLAALFSVPLFVLLGHWLWRKFSDDVEALQAALSRTHAYSLGGALAIALCAVGAGLLWYRWRRPS